MGTPTMRLSGGWMPEDACAIEKQLQSLMAEAQGRSDAKRALDSQIRSTEEEIVRLQSESSTVLQQCDAEEVEIALRQDRPPAGETDNRKRVAELARQIRFLQARIRGLSANRLPILEELLVMGQRADALHTRFCEQVFARFVEDYEAAVYKFACAYRAAVALRQAAAEGTAEGNLGDKFPEFWMLRGDWVLRHPVALGTELFNSLFARTQWARDVDALELHDSVVACEQQAAAIIRLARGD